MFGSSLGLGSSLLAPAAGALAGGGAAPRLFGRPSLSLAISGALHAGALCLFLALHGGPGVPEPPGIEIRAWPKPPPIVLPHVVPPASPRGGGRTDDEGIVTPTAEADPDLEVITEIASDVAPVRDGAGPPADRGSRDIGTEGTPPPPSAADPDSPSPYEEPPVAIRAPDPEYPDIARDAGIEGKFVVEALVGRDGRVLETRVGEANPILAEAARKAVRRWKFKPAHWNGRTVAAWVSIPVVFRLD